MSRTGEKKRGRETGDEFEETGKVFNVLRGGRGRQKLGVNIWLEGGKRKYPVLEMKQAMQGKAWEIIIWVDREKVE